MCSSFAATRGYLVAAGHCFVRPSVADRRFSTVWPTPDPREIDHNDFYGMDSVLTMAYSIGTRDGSGEWSYCNAAKQPQHARSDSNRRLPASKASAEPGFAEGSASRGPEVAALVHVLQDIRDGRYKPDEPVVHGLTMALDHALRASAPTRVDTTSRRRGPGC